ncbi:ABC transporter ATP-binding protein [Candidatus Cardinium hertigii]|uniref:ATP-binding cassette domain-containing protein n=1 Tax=Candidatus Cardinium hertigii TaxID=247481 RepID=A0A3N2QD43_9BACT|nr:ATP-binding cassette domain-containing protein [Candidatus Cardinium hertigii]ROT47691.1 ATP-binding cassette domain-containing protein [Candidatus Cardinium hertigii]ROT47697.1 ATP-binding cassette domain-containing protein [Candidatus Cardinium hertigii]
MISFENISKSFNNKAILDSVSGAFQAGQMSLVIGASGTGKSLLIKCLIGLIMPDQGNSLFDGRDLVYGDKPLQTEIRREMGMLFQGGALFDSKNIEENVRFPLDILTTMSLGEKQDRVNACLTQVGLPNVQRKMPNELSGGMKKRAGIARAIVNHPKYLFCDEPNSGLDPQTALKIDELIAEVTSTYQTTTVVVTHDMNTILSLGDFILFLHQGKKLWEGSSKDILHTSLTELQDFLFVGKFKELLSPSN